MDSKDRARFDRAVSKLLYTLNGTAKASPTVISAYWSILRGYSWDSVATAMTVAIREKTGHITPAELSQMCGPDSEAQQERREIEFKQKQQAANQRADEAGRKRWGKLWDSVEFQSMKDVANMEFNRRCSHQKAGGLRFPTPETKGYDGQFDYMEVVNAAELPRTKFAQDHANAWEAFWKLLKEEFGAYFYDTRNDADRPF